MKRLLFIVTWLVGMAASSVMAHSSGTSYLQLSRGAPGDAPALRLEVALRDLQIALGLDLDGDAAITWGELQAAEARYIEYVQRHLAVSRNESPCDILAEPVRVNQRDAEVYAVMDARVICRSGSGALSLRSDLMFDIDSIHRTLMRVEDDQGSALSLLTAGQRVWRAPRDTRSTGREFDRFMAEGIRHILIGWDHLAFILVLLLPAVHAGVAATQPSSSAADPRSFWSAMRRLLPIVTAFTVAHSITLALTVMGIVEPQPRLVELAIAASVAVAALGNLHPRLRRHGPTTAFVFGLLHGFGFAGVLAELDLEAVHRGTALLGFNLGVEVGQLVVIALALVPLRALAGHPAIRPRLVPVLSLAVSALGMLWVWQRSASGI